MKDRIAKVNKHIQRTFGEILHREGDVPAGALVTISKVETRPNLKYADIWLYVFPDDKGQEVIDQLTPQLYDLQGSLNRALDFQPLPRIRLLLDHGAAYAQNINEKLDSLK